MSVSRLPGDRGGEHLAHVGVERQQAVTVMGLPAQGVCQRGQDLVPPAPQGVVLGVCTRKSGI
jgi:hypothetical protein